MLDEQVKLIAMGMALQDYRDNGLESLFPCDEITYALTRYERYVDSANILAYCMRK